MPHPRVVEGEGVVDPVPGGEVAEEEGEVPMVTTPAKGLAMEEVREATPTIPRVVGVVAMVEVGVAVVEGAMEGLNKAMGKLFK